MAKIKRWLKLIKKLFVSDSKADPEKREKKRKWFIGRFGRNRLPALGAPSIKNRSLVEAQENYNNHAFTAAIATAVAAEAALASAQAAVEVIRLSGTPPLYIKCKNGSRAAIKIQTAYRGYLARKALRALKGVVRLQAMIRGQAVRRQVITALNGLQTLVKIQSKLRVKHKSWGDEDFLKHSNELGEKKMRPEVKSQRRLVNALPSKEDIDAMFLRRHEALIKKARVQENLLSQKEKISFTTYKASEANNNTNGSLDHWLGQMADAQERKANVVVNSNPMPKNNPGARAGDSRWHDPFAGRASPVTPPRRSFDRPTRSLYEDSDSQGSPIVPNYMSATESAKARLRSVSLPKRGAGSLDVYSDHHGSPYKNNMLIFSSINADGSVTIKSGKTFCSPQQKSPSLKGVSGPIRSCQSPKDRSVDSTSSEWSQMVFSKGCMR